MSSLSNVDKLADYDKLHEEASVIIVDLLPDLFNDTDTSHWSFEKIIEHLDSHSSPESHHVSNHTDDTHIDHGHDSGEHAADDFPAISDVLQVYTSLNTYDIHVYSNVYLWYWYTYRLFSLY